MWGVGCLVRTPPGSLDTTFSLSRHRQPFREQSGVGRPPRGSRAPRAADSLLLSGLLCQNFGSGLFILGSASCHQADFEKFEVGIGVTLLFSVITVGAGFLSFCIILNSAGIQVFL